MNMNWFGNHDDTACRKLPLSFRLLAMAMAPADPGRRACSTAAAA